MLARAQSPAVSSVLPPLSVATRLGIRATGGRIDVAELPNTKAIALCDTGVVAWPKHPDFVGGRVLMRHSVTTGPSGLMMMSHSSFSPDQTSRNKARQVPA